MLLCVLLLSVSCKTEKESATTPASSVRPQPSAQAVAQWRDQKFSMFIHFGLFSLPAGVWKGEKVTKGYSEQIRAHGKITKGEFHELAKSFNPVKWNPDSVVALAKLAGMKSIVITSKHHDGFAMYDTKYSDFNIVRATPYKRDILKELSEACKKQDIKFGVYFSLIDWDYPEALPISEHNSDSIPPKHHEFNLHQVEELMTNYGPISEIWFDMGKPTYNQSKELADLVRKYQPDCLVSGRLWNDQGDFAVMGDNASPDFKMGTLWQTPASMFDETWGYRSWQERGDPKQKASEKLTSLINVVSNGGNYLLNIGPMGDGGIVPFERDVLVAIGKWFSRNGEAVYGSMPSPLPEQSWGVLTSKPQNLFLFLIHPPADGKLVLNGFRSVPKRAYLLSDPSKEVGVKCAEGECNINVKSLSSNDMIKVVVLEYEGKLEYSPVHLVRKSDDGAYQLTLDNAIKYHSYSGHDYYSTKPTVIKLEWFIEDADEENYTLSINYTGSEENKRLLMKINGVSSEIILNNHSKIDDRSIALKPHGLNSVQISLADQSNPHQDMHADGLTITVKK